jgi:class 3 adenylate cyclase
MLRIPRPELRRYSDPRILLSKGRAGYKAVFNCDYSYVTRFVGILFWIGVPAEIFYFWFESSHGYWDSFPLRATLSATLGTLIFRNWKTAKGRLPILHWELAMFLVFPFQSTLSLLQNNGGNYYANSLIMMFFILGLLTKAWMIPIHMVIGGGMTSLGWFLYHGWDARLFSVCLPAQVNALFSGIVSSAVMLVLENNHRRITEAKVALAKAEEEKAQAAEIAKAYQELKKREELIRVYVRPSLAEEIRAGKDPSQEPPVLRNLSIMFCDIREFTRLTEVLTPFERQTFLNKYFTMMTQPIAKNGGEVDKIMGDCVMGVFPDGAAAVQAAIDMRLELQAFNQSMYRSGAALIRNGIGIAKGEVMQANFGSIEKLDRTVIGEAVNIAARLEAKTKMYNLEVVVTEDVIRDLPPGTGHHRWIDVVQVKGSSRHLKLYEVYGHQPEEVRRFKDETRDMLEKALTIYFHKGFEDASRLFRAMLDVVPPHRLIRGDLMDNLLRYYIEHCEAWMTDRAGAWEAMDKWSGVHVFFEK